jgi:hypothetical protein
MQPPEESLRPIARATRTSVLFDSSAVAGKAGRALSGSYMADEAADVLLRGGTLQVRKAGANTITVVEGQSTGARPDDGVIRLAQVASMSGSDVDSSAPGTADAPAASARAEGKTAED